MDKKTTVDDIIGIVHTDEPTDSVEEVCKLRGRTNERFIVDDAGTLINMVTRDTFDYVSDVVGLLNDYDKENEQLKNMVGYIYEEHKRCVNNYGAKIKEVEKENEQLKQNIEVILKYCREKGKYAMDMEEIRAHNVLQTIINDWKR